MCQFFGKKQAKFFFTKYIVKSHLAVKGRYQPLLLGKEEILLQNGYSIMMEDERQHQPSEYKAKE